MDSSKATVSERPSCLAASSQSAFDVTLSQKDSLVTRAYPPRLDHTFHEYAGLPFHSKIKYMDDL